MIGSTVSSSSFHNEDESCWSEVGVYNPEEDPMLGFSSALIERLRQSQKELTEFINAQKKKVDDIQASHKSVVASEQTAIDELLLQHQQIEAKRGVDSDGRSSGIVHQRQSLRQTQLQIEKEIATLRIQKDTKLRDLKAVKEEEDFQRSLAEDKRRAKEIVEESKKTTVDDLTYAIVKYKALGLDFLKTDNNSLSFRFTQIDARNPDRPFTFTLNVNDQDLYEVEECQPPLKATAIINLLDILNADHIEDDAFSRFIYGMRSAFQDSIPS